MTAPHDRHLLYFVRVADAGGLSAAARSLGVSQPALSAAMQRLQRDIGVSLFRSHGRGLDLTAEGEALLIHARSAVRAMEDFSATARLLVNGDSGVVTVAAPSGVSISILAPLIRTFTQMHPADQVHMARTYALDETLAVLRDGQADIALLPRLEVPQDLDGFTVGYYEFVLAVPSAVSLPKGPVTLRDLDRLPFITSRPGTAAHRLLSSARSAGADPRVVMVEPEMASLPQLVAEGVGAGVVVAPMRPQLAAMGVDVRPFAHHERWPVRVVYRNTSLSSPATRFIAATRIAA